MIDTPEPNAPVYERSEYIYRALIVVRSEDRDGANTQAAELDEASGPDTFSVGLSMTGQEPATHYWCSVLVTDVQWKQLLQMKALLFPTAVITEWYLDADPDKSSRVLSELGLQRIEPAITIGEN